MMEAHIFSFSFIKCVINTNSLLHVQHSMPNRYIDFKKGCTGESSLTNEFLIVIQIRRGNVISLQKFLQSP